MPTFVSVPDAIFHLHEESDVDPSAYIDQAEAIAIDFLNRKVYPDQATLDANADADAAADPDGPLPIVVNPAIKAGILLTLGNLWSNRGDAERSGGQNVLVDSGAQSLLLPYRAGFGG